MRVLTSPFMLVTIVVGLVGWALTSWALGDGGPPPRPRPPPQAFAACRGRTRGDACSIRPPFGEPRAIEQEGTCLAPEGLPVACVPRGAPP